MRVKLIALFMALFIPSALPVMAKTHFNSRQKLITNFSAFPRHKNLVLADMNGDGFKELVGYTQDAGGFKISVGSNGWPTTLLASYDSHADWWNWRMPNGSVIWIDQVFVGKFTSTTRESFCFNSKANYYNIDSSRIYCFDQSGSSLYQPSGSGQTMPLGWSIGNSQLGSQIVTGDFDGDGYDEVITYNGSSGNNIRMWEYNQWAPPYIYYGFSGKSDFDLGNLNGFSLSGPVTFHVGNFSNHANEGIRDDLLIVNESTRQSYIYHARRDGYGRTTFWVLIGPTGAIHSSGEEISVADADGDGLEDLIAHDVLYGNNRFVFLKDSCLFCTMPYKRPESGNLPWYGSPRETHLFFGKMDNHPGEGGNTNARDDVWLFDVPSNQYYRYGARWCAPGAAGCPSYGSQTYWVWFNKPVSTMLSELQMSYGGMP